MTTARLDLAWSLLPTKATGDSVVPMAIGALMPRTQRAPLVAQTPKATTVAEICEETATTSANTPFLSDNKMNKRHKKKSGFDLVTASPYIIPKFSPLHPFYLFLFPFFTEDFRALH